MKLFRIFVAICFVLATISFSFASGEKASGQAPAQASEKVEKKETSPEKQAPKPETKKVAKQPEAPININTASEEELMKLPGVGPKLAKGIVEYRTKNGPFNAPEDLMKVKGIGQKKFEKMKDFVVVK